MVSGSGLALRVTASWMLMRAALETPCRLMERKGLPVAAVKGWDLSQSLYPFEGCRPMGDVDLLLPPARAAEALQAFLSCGWKAMGPGRGLFSSGTVSEMKLVSPRGQLVELHTHPFYFPSTFPGRSPQLLPAPNRRLEPGLGALAWPDSLAFLLLNVLAEPSTRPTQWVDIAASCRKLSNLDDWLTLCRRLAPTGLGPAAGSVLEMAADLGAVVPHRVLALLRSFPDRRRVLRALHLGRGVPTLTAVLLGGWRGISLGAAQLARLVLRQGALRQHGGKARR